MGNTAVAIPSAPDLAVDPTQAMLNTAEATTRGAGRFRMGGVAAVIGDCLPGVACFAGGVAGHATGQATRSARASSQTPAGPTALPRNPRRRRTRLGEN